MAAIIAFSGSSLALVRGAQVCRVAKTYSSSGDWVLLLDFLEVEGAALGPSSSDLTMSETFSAILLTGDLTGDREPLLRRL